MPRSIRILFSGLSSLDFFPFSELARAERFLRGIRAAVSCYSLFWLLLLQMFTFLQKKSWFTCIIYFSTKARPKKWFNRSKIIHKITFLKKLPISDAVTLVMWCWSKMKCVYLTFCRQTKGMGCLMRCSNNWPRMIRLEVSKQFRPSSHTSASAATSALVTQEKEGIWSYMKDDQMRLMKGLLKYLE